MYIELPEYYSSNMGYVLGNRLFLNKILNFEKVMYDLTYSIYEFRCVYCGKKLTDSTKTLDHLIPRAIGGVTITNNLRPCCRRCNSSKGDKTRIQYLDSRKLSKKDLKKYNDKQRKWKENIYEEKGFFLPNEWLTIVAVPDVRGIVNENYPLGRSYFSALGFYTTYKNFPRPIVLDKDFNLLDGYTIIQLARNQNINRVPAVICENVRF